MANNIDTAGLQFIANFEGNELKLYNDPTGNCTIGVGHLVHMGNCNGAPSEMPYKNGLTTTESLALFRTDLTQYVAAVNNQVKVPLNQNQFNALVSLLYNVGVGGAPGLILLLNSKNYTAAANAFLNYDHAGGQVLPGLLARRQAERNLFLTPINSTEGEDMQIDIPGLVVTTYLAILGRGPTNPELDAAIKLDNLTALTVQLRNESTKKPAGWASA